MVSFPLKFGASYTYFPYTFMLQFVHFLHQFIYVKENTIIRLQLTLQHMLGPQRLSVLLSNNHSQLFSFSGILAKLDTVFCARALSDMRVRVSDIRLPLCH